MKENKIIGVYKITNIITGEFYIGSSKDVKRRWVNHKCPSTHKRYPNVKLYKAMAKYGLNNFTFDIIEETADLKEREQYWIEQLKPTYNDRHADGYNTDRRKQTNKRCQKEWYKAHRNEYIARNKDWHKAHRDKQLAKMKAYCSRLCLYNGETLTLAALNIRFCRQGIPHPTLNAKKYLIKE